MKKALLFILLFTSTMGFSQIKKTLHQTFKLGEAESVTLKVRGEVSIEQWEGNRIMAETKVVINNAPQSLMNLYMKEKRYDLETSVEEGVLWIKSKKVKHRTLIFKGVESSETVKIKLYLPKNVPVNIEDFEKEISDEQIAAGNYVAQLRQLEKLEDESKWNIDEMTLDEYDERKAMLAEKRAALEKALAEEEAKIKANEEGAAEEDYGEGNEDGGDY